MIRPTRAALAALRRLCTSLYSNELISEQLDVLHYCITDVRILTAVVIRPQREMARQRAPL